MTLLHNTAKPYPTLLNLLAKLPPLLTIGSENLRTTIYILQAYVLLCPLKVMETVGVVVVQELSSQYTDLQDEGVLMILRLVETWLRAGPPNTHQILEPLLLTIMEAVHAGTDFPMLMSLHLSILSRLVLSSHQLFSSLCLTTAAKLNSNHNDVAGEFTQRKYLKHFLIKIKFLQVKSWMFGVIRCPVSLLRREGSC